jgi:hypothetical protein
VCKRCAGGREERLEERGWKVVTHHAIARQNSFDGNTAAKTEVWPNLPKGFPEYWPNLKCRRYLYSVGVFCSATQVVDRLFLGSLDDAEALASANPHHITTVISLCRELVRRQAPGFRYLHFPVRDARPISVAWLNAILPSLEEAMYRGAVLVHCGAGMSRAPAVVAAFLDRIGFLGFVRAMSYLEDLRPAAAPSTALVESIERELSHSTGSGEYR